MNAIRSHLFVVVAGFGLMSLSVAMVRAQQNAQQKDVVGGASLLFKRHQNPPTHRSKNLQRSSSNAPQGEKSKPLAMQQTKDNLSDAVEDALALGNTARDRTPPDFASAEKAYRLALKLSPQDPRPHVGLGNIYFDQQRYPEAAKAYKEAIKLKETATSSTALMSRQLGIRSIRAATDTQTGEWHVYLATAMLQQENLTGAERELRHAVAIDPKNATWLALLGYGLFTQKRYTEASAFYEDALHLDPNNDTYKRLLGESLPKALAASAQDEAIANRMEGTKWQIQKTDSGRIQGTCRLRTGQRLDCKFSGNQRSRYDNVRWKIQDELFRLESASSSASAPHQSLLKPSCIGEMRTDRIYIKCLLPGMEGDEVWTKRDRD